MYRHNINPEVKPFSAAAAVCSTGSSTTPPALSANKVLTSRKTDHYRVLLLEILSMRRVTPSAKSQSIMNTAR